MSEPAKAPVPKFSSFRPNNKRPASPEPRQAAAPDQYHLASKRHRRSASPARPVRDRDSHRDRAVDRDRDNHHSRSSRHRHARDTQELPSKPASEHHVSSSPSTFPSARVHQIQPKLDPFISHLYTVDRKGDPQNWTYQRLHKYHVPPYRRVGYGIILGLASRYKIDKENSIMDQVHLIDTLHHASSRERKLLKRPKQHLQHDLQLSSHHPEDSTTSFDPASDFVSLHPNSRERSDSPVSESDSRPLDEVRGLSADKTAGPLLSHPDLHPAENRHIKEGDLHTDVEVRQRTVELSRRTKLEPTSLHAWLSLIEHQAHLVRPGTSLADLSNTERRTLADMRLHIYEKADRNIKDKSSREILLHHMLQEASLVWTTEKYVQKVNQVIQEHPESLRLWTLLLDRIQTNAVDFQFEDRKKTFLHCLGKINSDLSYQDTKDIQLYIVLRYTTFLCECGYEELSIAIWQALLEFNVFRPTSLQHAETAVATTAFEQFWESETPRIGDPGARGWHQADLADQVLQESTQSLEIDDPGLEHKYSSFSKKEQEASHVLCCPGRTTDQIAADDPFHVVLFEDVCHVLEATYSPTNVIDAFLCYLGLPPKAGHMDMAEHWERIQTWRSDVFLGRGLLGDSATAETDGTERPHIERFRTSIRSLFSQSFRPMTDNESLRFSRRCLELIVDKHNTDFELAEYYIAFLCQYYPSEAPKIAKRLSKKAPFSIRLYNACALVEAVQGRPDKATKILSGTIKMQDSFPPSAKRDIVYLWQSWMWDDFQRGQGQTALLSLASSGDNPEPDLASLAITSSAMLRAKRMFQDGFEHALTDSSPHLAYANAECLVLLAYFSHSDALNPALGVLQQLSSTVSKSSIGLSAKAVIELLHQTKSDIIAVHIAQNRPYKPAFVRAELEASINLFPNNTKFLQLYRQTESRFRIDDRVRTVLKDQAMAEQGSPMIRWSFAIDQEMSRYRAQVSGSTVESVRAVFSRALADEQSQVRHSKTLWLRWLRFEEKHAQRQMDAMASLPARTHEAAGRKLRDVFLQGLRSLPWCKGWILEGFWIFDSDAMYAWNERELQQLADVLREREFRIRMEEDLP